jgi:hypothetical protein
MPGRFLSEQRGNETGERKQDNDCRPEEGEY